MKKISRKIIAVCMMMAVLTLSVVPAFASGSNDVRTYSWLQATNPTLEEPCGTISAWDGSTLIFQGIATSSQSGQFKVKLQKKGLFGIWSDTNNVYTVRQHHNQTYDTVNNHYVTGQFYRLYWNIHENGTYRVVLYNPSAPQVCGLSQTIFYIQ